MGQTFTVQAANGSSPKGPSAPDRFTRPARVQQADGFYTQVETELDDMRKQVRVFPDQDPSDVLMAISGIAGRLAEIRAWLYRDNSQRCTQIRTREVDPLRDDLDLQFKLFSRRIALMEWELKMSGGGI
jgi:hypothetical protein